jgi:GWxTD domain-containing protein
MKKIFFITLLLSFCIYPQKKIDFEFDYAQFAYDSSQNFVEFYYSFNQGTMTPVVDSLGERVDGILKIVLKDSVSGDVIMDNQWKVSHYISEDESHDAQSLIGVVGFILPEGTLSCEVTGIDFNDSKNFKSILDNIHVSSIFKDEIGMSDIQLAYKLVQGSENESSIFYKNTYEVIPVPNLVFGKEQPVLFYYVELYHLDNLLKQDSNLKLNQMILNSRGRIVFTKDKYLSRSADSRVEVGSAVIAQYPTDTYTIILSLIDSVNNKGVSTSKKFFVYNPDIISEEEEISGDLSILSTTFGSMSEEELDDIFNKAKFIATSTEIDRYEKLTNEDGKRQFMNEFWQVRDEYSETSRNEYYLNYIQRVEIANARYATLSRPGWKTDRGRVFLLFGEPSEIERYPSQVETRPYEIWHYNEIEGGVYFIFADLLGFSDYSLVHSTKRGELRDDNWVRRIYVR